MSPTSVAPEPVPLKTSKSCVSRLPPKTSPPPMSNSGGEVAIWATGAKPSCPKPNNSLSGSRVKPPMVNASGALLMSPASRPVKASPGCRGAAASMLPNSESRLTLPNGVTSVSVTVSAPPAVPGMAV